jgi:hypothetical protein
MNMQDLEGLLASATDMNRFEKRERRIGSGPEAMFAPSSFVRETRFAREE